MRSDTDTTTTTQANATTTPAPKPAPPVKAKPNGSKPVKAAPKAKAAKKEPASNVVTLADICREMKIETKVARVRLRASKLKKSADGWQWQKGSAVIKEVRKIIVE